MCFDPLYYTRYLMTELLDMDQTCTMDTAYIFLYLGMFLRSEAKGEGHKIFSTEMQVKKW